MAPKRKSSSSSGSGDATKTTKREEADSISSSTRKYHPNAKQTAESGIVLRQFYPPEMSNERCRAYAESELERPIETLEKSLADQSAKQKDIKAGDAVVYWFKSDLRLFDNRALANASRKAQESKVPLICLYMFSPEDFTAHLISPPRIDFILRNLKKLQGDLDGLDIPLYMETQEHRRDIPGRIIELCKGWGANHLYANFEYDVDELRRDAKIVEEGGYHGIDVSLWHDVCTIAPGILHTKQGKQYSKFNPWFKAWTTYIQEHPEVIELSEKPGKNEGEARGKKFKDLFDCPLPQAPKNKPLDAAKAKGFAQVFPEGEDHALRRLNAFLHSDNFRKYHDTRHMVAMNTTSKLSPYFSAGVLSSRTAVKTVMDICQEPLRDDTEGYMSWVSEVSWREFYKHVLVHWPFMGMNKAFHPEYTDLQWTYDADKFQAWAEGRTGLPIVDAAMRQLERDAWMHNRSRMIVASFLSKDFFIDWRLGEKYFMEHLIDGDFASNHGGWGFSSSTGVEPQPWFRINNPVLQSERFDPNGDYIREFVPELAGITDRKAIHDPYARGKGDVAEKNGYPRPMVDHAETRARAMAMFKSVVSR